jgi:hypothetical protein
VIARVYITPASGVGGEFPVPVPFNLRHYSRRYVRAYAAGCRRLGQGARIVWP